MNKLKKQEYFFFILFIIENCVKVNNHCKMVNISKIEKDKNNLNIKWSDGEISSFNYL